jgi:hypothetical protein
VLLPVALALAVTFGFVGFGVLGRLARLGGGGFML